MFGVCELVALGSCSDGRDDEVLRRRAVSVRPSQLHLRCSRQPTTGSHHDGGVSSRGSLAGLGELLKALRIIHRRERVRGGDVLKGEKTHRREILSSLDLLSWGGSMERSLMDRFRVFRVIRGSWVVRKTRSTKHTNQHET